MCVYVHQIESNDEAFLHLKCRTSLYQFSYDRLWKFVHTNKQHLTYKTKNHFLTTFTNAELQFTNLLFSPLTIYWFWRDNLKCVYMVEGFQERRPNQKKRREWEKEKKKDKNSEKYFHIFWWETIIITACNNALLDTMFQQCTSTHTHTRCYVNCVLNVITSRFIFFSMTYIRSYHDIHLLYQSNQLSALIILLSFFFLSFLILFMIILHS